MRILLIVLSSLLVGCTAGKCVQIEMLDQNSTLNLTFPTPRYGIGSLALGSAKFSGKNTYQSCPAEVGSGWFTSSKTSNHSIEQMPNRTKGE